MPKGQNLRKHYPNEATLFKKGNTIGIGNKGRGNPSLITQELISVLNEMDKNTGKAKKYVLADKLVMLALGYKYKQKKTVVDPEGKERTIEVEVEVQPDIIAIREVFDRAEGKAKQQVSIDSSHQQTLRVEFEDITAAREKLGKMLELKAQREEEQEQVQSVNVESVP